MSANDRNKKSDDKIFGISFGELIIIGILIPPIGILLCMIILYCVIEKIAEDRRARKASNAVARFLRWSIDNRN